jgi:endonuclease YncB( thermonuclease family)
MVRFFRCALALVALSALFLSLAGCRYSEGVLVEWVIDGDTIVIRGGERVRYIGIDTPEQDEPYGRLAAEANWELAGGRLVRLETDVS